MKILVLGAGAYGAALGGVLVENGHEVVYYDPIKATERVDGDESGRSESHDDSKSGNLESDCGVIYANLTEALGEAEAMVLCVPSEVAEELLAQLPRDTFLIVATKGFLTEAPFAVFHDWVVLSGPGFAKDIKAKKQTYLTVTDERLKQLFSAEYIACDQTKDRLGVLMCGALKNVYALWAGYCVLRPGTEAHEKYLSDVADEMRAMLLANGANPLTVGLYCGVDDLRMTCGPGSRNYAYGIELMESPKARPNVTVEGLAVLKRIEQGEINLPGNLPYLESLIMKSKEWK